MIAVAVTEKKYCGAPAEAGADMVDQRAAAGLFWVASVGFPRCVTNLSQHFRSVTPSSRSQNDATLSYH